MCAALSIDHIPVYLRLFYHPRVSVRIGHPGRCFGRLRVMWGKAPPFGDDLSLNYLFASTSEKVTCM